MIFTLLQAHAVIRTKVNSERKKEMKLNRAIFSSSIHIQPTDTALFVTGVCFDVEAVDVFSLLESLRSELRILQSLRTIGFSNTKLGTLQTLDLSTTMDKQEFAMDIREAAIM